MPANIASVTITRHTTASTPRPHVVYIIDAVSPDGERHELFKRYSDFVAFHARLGDDLTLPPKRILSTAFVPSAWADDVLITERKAGLAVYLNALLSSKQYGWSSALQSFLDGSVTPDRARALDLEDALPSTLTRKAALEAQQTLAASAAPLIAAAYYPDWSADSIPPEKLDFSKFDVLNFAFATPSSSSGISFDSGSTAILKRLVASANSSGKGTKIVLSIGGWGGCQYYSQTMSSAGNRTTFVNACVSAVNTYGLAGVDFDWEYPNSPGAGQPYSAQDSANFLSFLTSLRTALGSSKIISGAVTDLPWLGANGNPLTDVSAYAKQLTYVNVMNYDVWGASSTPGPNAPLGNLCNTSTQPQYSAQAALKQWTAAKFPAAQLILGLPLYGYVSQSSATRLTGSFAGALVPTGAPETQGSGEAKAPQMNFLDNKHDRRALKGRVVRVSPDAKAAGDLSPYWGQQIAFSDIIALGALVKSGSAYVGTNGYTEGWDNCSDTPFLYNTLRTTVVTYDDTYSLADKATFAKNSGLGGCFTWSLDQDDGYTLQNVIRASLGK